MLLIWRLSLASFGLESINCRSVWEVVVTNILALRDVSKIIPRSRIEQAHLSVQSSALPSLPIKCVRQAIRQVELEASIRLGGSESLLNFVQTIARY